MNNKTMAGVLILMFGLAFIGISKIPFNKISGCSDNGTSYERIFFDDGTNISRDTVIELTKNLLNNKNIPHGTQFTWRTQIISEDIELPDCNYYSGVYQSNDDNIYMIGLKHKMPTLDDFNKSLAYCTALYVALSINANESYYKTLYSAFYTELGGIQYEKRSSNAK